jgi:hypothetical protein
MVQRQMRMFSTVVSKGTFEELVRSAKTGWVIDFGNHYRVSDWGLTDKGIIIVRRRQTYTSTLGAKQRYTFTFISYDGNTKRVVGRFPSVYGYEISASGLVINPTYGNKYCFDESGFSCEDDTEILDSTIEILPPKHKDEFTEFLGQFRRNSNKREHHRVIFRTRDLDLHLFNYRSRKHTVIFPGSTDYTFEAREQGVVIKDSKNGLFFIDYKRPRSVVKLPPYIFDKVNVCPFGVVIQHHNNFSLVVVK